MGQARKQPGLHGEVVGETSISTVEGGLQYRGYAVRDLAEDAAFEEVAFLLLRGRLPSEEELADFEAVLIEASEVPEEVLDFLAGLPLHVNEMDVLRTAVSALSHWDMQADELGSAANLHKAERLLGQIPILIAARFRQRQGLEVLQPLPDLTLAGNLLWLIHGTEPSPLAEKAMNVAMILTAEHEFNTATFAARIVASTEADLHSAVVAGISALKGPGNGGADEQVLHLLLDVRSPDRAEAWAKNHLNTEHRIWGFGHAVYTDRDPRAVILKDYCRLLAEDRGLTRLEEVSEIIERIARDHRGLFPNLDWAVARLYYYLGIDAELFTPLFVAGRIAGWCAHVIEQGESSQPIRPRAKYTGPTGLQFDPLEERD